MKTVSVKFSNYYRSYAFKTNLPLKEGKMYKIVADGTKYSTSVSVEGYLNKAPEGIVLKEITDAIEVVENG